MFKLRISARARTQLKKITKEYEKGSINTVLEDIIDNPFLGKPLSDELTGRIAYKVGVYRIVYLVNIKDEIVTIIDAGHRSTIYN